MADRLKSLIDNKSRLGSLILLVFACAYLRASLDVQIDMTFGEESFNSRTMPIALAVASIACALVQLLTPLIGQSSDPSTPDDATEQFYDGLKRANWRQVVSLLILMLLYTFTFQWLGFFLGGASFLFCGFLLLGERSYFTAAIVALALVGTMWLLLTQLFGLFLDSGELLRILSGLSS